MVGLDRVHCPKTQKALIAARDELAKLEKKKDALEELLAGLIAIENSVDQITLFDSSTHPASGLKVTVGTVYRQFVTPMPQPDHFYCYINLDGGGAAESRTLYVRRQGGAVAIEPNELLAVGVTEEALRFARSVCEPYLIGT